MSIKVESVEVIENIKSEFMKLRKDEESLDTIRHVLYMYDLCKNNPYEMSPKEVINDFIHCSLVASTKSDNRYTKKFVKYVRHAIFKELNEVYITYKFLVTELCNKSYFHASIRDSNVADEFAEMCFDYIDVSNSSNSNPLASVQSNYSNTPTDSLDVIRAALAKFL